MKIRAIRLREVGVFRQGIAIEGFSGALDVLSGANELGKSTVLRALKRLFLSKHTAAGNDIEILRPHGGGAPLIEADFEAAGSLWRLRKQFLSSRAAELSELPSGRTVERGADAHARALHLIGLGDDDAKSRGPLGLLWVDQEHGPRPLAISSNEKSLLLDAIGGEITDVAAGRSLRIIRERIGAELAIVQTERTRKPRGDYDAALKLLQSLEIDLAGAREEFRHIEDKQSELERLRDRRRHLTDPALLSAGAELLTAARHAVDEGRRAREQHRLALATRREFESKREQIAAAASAIQARLREQAELSALVATLGPQIAAAEHAAKASAASASSATDRRVQTEADYVNTRTLLRAVERHDALMDLRLRNTEARQVERQRAELEIRLSANPATLALVRKAEAEQRSIELLQAEIEATSAAAAPRVMITYAPGVRDKISVDGRTLLSGEELQPTAPMILDIAGIGSITITPVVSSDLAGIEADLQAHRDELNAVLGFLSVPDVAAARAALTQKRDDETSLAAARDRLANLARDGLAAVEQRLVAVERAAEADPPLPVDIPDRATLSERVAALEQTHRTSILAAEEATRVAAQHAQTLERLGTTAENRHSRLATLATELAQHGDPASQSAKLELDLADATAAANAAIRDAAAWQEAAPSDTAWQALQQDLAQAEAAQARTVAELANLDQKIAHAEGELAHVGASDLSQKIDEMEGELDDVRRQVAHFEAEIAALTLLDRELQLEQSSAKDRFLIPVLARIEPYLQQVLPEAQLHLSDGFAPAGLARGNGIEAEATLSGGTREQLAVLTRLGFGRLLADRGQAAPVILDDALVYSDDTRIERLFDVLRAASESHQVIVLTCRSRLFETLGGTQLSLTPWTPS